MRSSFLTIQEFNQLYLIAFLFILKKSSCLFLGYRHKKDRRLRAMNPLFSPPEQFTFSPAYSSFIRSKISSVCLKKNTVILSEFLCIASKL